MKRVFFSLLLATSLACLGHAAADRRTTSAGPISVDVETLSRTDHSATVWVTVRKSATGAEATLTMQLPEGVTATWGAASIPAHFVGSRISVVELSWNPENPPIDAVEFAATMKSATARSAYRVTRPDAEAAAVQLSGPVPFFD